MAPPTEKLEQETRIEIDKKLIAAGWAIQDKSRLNLFEKLGVAETKSLETKPSVSTAKLMEQVARGNCHSETLRALGNRMIRLNLEKLRRCEQLERSAA